MSAKERPLCRVRQRRRSSYIGSSGFAQEILGVVDGRLPQQEIEFFDVESGRHLVRVATSDIVTAVRVGPKGDVLDTIPLVAGKRRGGGSRSIPPSARAKSGATAGLDKQVDQVEPELPGPAAVDARPRRRPRLRTGDALRQARPHLTHATAGTSLPVD